MKPKVTKAQYEQYKSELEELISKEDISAYDTGRIIALRYFVEVYEGTI